jgi:hypothetical protein
MFSKRFGQTFRKKETQSYGPTVFSCYGRQAAGFGVLDIIHSGDVLFFFS